jgi:nucleotide-binding universal stress UspA family protein
MKRLLIPIDFSPASESAFAYALSLSAGLQVNLLVLLHVQKPGVSDSDATQSIDPAARLAELAGQAEEVLGEQVTVLSKVLRGEPEEVIERLARQFESDLIVMGATGAGDSAINGYFLGNVAGTMFKLSELPMLFVPEGTQFRPPRKLAFVVKSLMVYKQEALGPLTAFAQAFSSELAVVQVKATSIDEVYGKECNMNLAGTEHNIYQITCDNVPSGIDKVIATFEPEILCVIRRKRDFFETMFKAPTVAASDFRSSVPVLVLQGAR